MQCNHSIGRLLCSHETSGKRKLGRGLVVLSSLIPERNEAYREETDRQGYKKGPLEGGDHFLALLPWGQSLKMAGIKKLREANFEGVVMRKGVWGTEKKEKGGLRWGRALCVAIQEEKNGGKTEPEISKFGLGREKWERKVSCRDRVLSPLLPLRCHALEMGSAEVKYGARNKWRRQMEVEERAEGQKDTQSSLSFSRQSN